MLNLIKKCEEIQKTNLTEKAEEETIHFKTCKECWYYQEANIKFQPLHCCAYNIDEVITNRDIEQLYKNCPINHQDVKKVKYLKRYALWIEEPDPDDFWYNKGVIRIEDYEDTVFEMDGHNPDYNEEEVAKFYYENDEQKEVMLKTALKLYEDLNLNEEYSIKKYYG